MEQPVTNNSSPELPESEDNAKPDLPDLPLPEAETGGTGQSIDPILRAMLALC